MLREKTVLVVDDSPIIQQTTRLILQKSGFTYANIHIATNAKDAVKASQTLHFDILLLDYNLGDGGTGLQLLEHLHYHNLLAHHPLILIITADDSVPVFMGFSEYEPDDYLVKPLRTGSLQKRLLSNFAQKQLSDNVWHAFKTAGVNGTKNALKQAKSEQSFRYTVTALCKQLARTGNISTAISLLNNFTQKHPYFPARLLLADLYINQKRLTEASEIVTDLQENHPSHLNVLELSAQLAIQQGAIKRASQFWLQAHQLSHNNLVRLISLLWLELTTSGQSKATLLRHLREACAHLSNSIWDNSGIHCLLTWGIMMHSDKNIATVEMLWCQVTHQKSPTPAERPFITLLTAWLAVRSGNTLQAYKHLNRLKQTAATADNFEFQFLLLRLYQQLSMCSPQKPVFKTLYQLAESEQRSSHRQIKRLLIYSERHKLQQNSPQFEQQALRLYQQRQYPLAGQKLLSAWQQNRFNPELARCLLELYINGHLLLSPEQRFNIIEARWTFESQEFIPEWYQSMKKQNSSLHAPIEHMTNRITGQNAA